MAGKPAHKYFSFQALTRAYFIHSMPIFFFLSSAEPTGGICGALSDTELGDVPVLLLLDTFTDYFHL